MSTKKDYEKPVVIYKQTMESVATACDPNQNGKGDAVTCSVLNS